MAETAEVSAGIDASLHDVAAELQFLPERAATWAQEPQDNRLSFSLEWDELMDRLLSLADAHAHGHMTANQQVRYHDLVRRLRDALPLIERLNLTAPALARD